MRKMSKRTTAIVTGVVAVGVIAAGTVAYAAFTRTANANFNNQQAENFAPMTVSATWIGVRPAHSGNAISTRLLPGDSADLKISITNPSWNTVNGKVTTINAVQLTDASITGIDQLADRQYCRGALALRNFAPGSNLIIPPNTTVDVELDDAVVLHPDTDLRCSNMTFPTDYQVTFQATREVAHSNTHYPPAA